MAINVRLSKVEYARGVVRDLKDLPKEIKRRALQVIEESLTTDPRIGRPLTGPYKGLWKYRVGDYRIVYAIEDKKLVVFVLRIRHRKDVYHGIIS